MKFPSQKLADVEDNGKVPVIVERHPEGKNCPASRRPAGDRPVLGCSAGRSTRTASPWPTRCARKTTSRTASTCPSPCKRRWRRRSDAGSDRFRLADDLARLLMSHAFLGELDVNPLGDTPRRQGRPQALRVLGRKRSRGPTTVLSGSASRASRKPWEYRRRRPGRRPPALAARGQAHLGGAHRDEAGTG